MAIGTYGELKTAVASWLEDSTLTSRIPEFIALAQAKMYRGVMGPGGWAVPPLRIRDMLTSASITVTSGAGSLPAGWLEFLRLWVDTSGQPNLKYLPAQTFYDEPWAHETTGSYTYFYTIEGSTIRTAPASSATLKSVYYAKFTAMSADGDADWIVTNAPHVYLHGALAEAWGYKLDGEQEAKHVGLFAQAVKGLNAADAQAQHAGSQMIMRPRTVV